jgi:hypothetical protein
MNRAPTVRKGGLAEARFLATSRCPLPDPDVRRDGSVHGNGFSNTFSGDIAIVRFSSDDIDIVRSPSGDIVNVHFSTGEIVVVHCALGEIVIVRIASGGSVVINDSRGNYNHNGSIYVGETGHSSPPPATTLDGRILVKDTTGGDDGNNNGFITVRGCHADATDLDPDVNRDCVCGDVNGNVFII